VQIADIRQTDPGWQSPGLGRGSTRRALPGPRSGRAAPHARRDWPAALVHERAAPTATADVGLPGIGNLIGVKSAEHNRAVRPGFGAP